MGRLARIPLEYKLERTEVKSSDSMVLAQWREYNTCMKQLQLAVKHNVVLRSTYRRWWFEHTGMAHCYHGDGQRIPILPYLCFRGSASALPPSVFFASGWLCSVHTCSIITFPEYSSPSVSTSLSFMWTLHPVFLLNLLRTRCWPGLK